MNMMEDVPRARGGVVCARPWATMIIREIYIGERAGGNYREIKKVFVSR